MHVFPDVCVFVCMSGPPQLNGSAGRWKGKVFKGHMYLSRWVLLHFQLSVFSCYPRPCAPNHKTLLSPSEKSLYSPAPEVTVR